MSSPLSQAFAQNFLGHSPRWYKLTVLAFLLLNPLLLWLAGPVTSAWVLVGEFIFTLAMALKCYPLQPGGLLVLEALLLGLATPEALYAELQHNFPVLLLLMFMVAGIYFMKDLLLLLFSRLLLGVRSKTLLSLLFCLLAALLSAFLDALTVTAVVISVAVAFFAVYHRVASGQRASEDYDPATDRQVPELHRAHLEEFRAFLRQQHLVTPIIQAVLALPAERQPGMLFIANGLLSAISDNVFVATIYITEVKQALDAGHMSREHFDTLAVAINTGTNLPSVATPNGQAAFLFLLTSSIAPLVRLSYGRMVWMALPYTLVMGGLGWWAVSHWL